MPFTAWLETTALSVWMREAITLWAFPFVLIVHAWGMGFLAGANAAVDLRILGFASRVPLNAMQRFYPVMWFGFVINAVSGILLFIGYPTKAATNPVFYLKLGFILAGMILMLRLRSSVVREPAFDTAPITGGGKLLAGLSLFCWAGAIVAGRLLAYTCTWLLADIPC